MENKAIRLDSLKEQLRHLAVQPDFVAQFLHEGAYVFPEQSHTLEPAVSSVMSEKTEQTENDPQPSPLVVAAESPKAPSPKVEFQTQPQEQPTFVQQPKAAEPVVQKAAPEWQNKVVVLLPPEPSIKEVQLLHKILGASGVTDAQVFIQEKLFQAKSLGQYEGSRIVLSFGAVTDFKADYQLRSKAITVIMADKLAHIEADVDAKKKLWAAMKSFFS